MPNNYAMAPGHLKSLKKKNPRGKDMQFYHELLQSNLENKFIQRITNAFPTDVCH